MVESELYWLLASHITSQASGSALHRHHQIRSMMETTNGYLSAVRYHSMLLHHRVSPSNM